MNNDTAIIRVREEDGNLKNLTEIERKQVYLHFCNYYQLDPLSFPIDYIENKGKLKAYINSIGAAQLRDRYQISIRIKSRELISDLWIVIAVASRGNRTEEATGAVAIGNTGETKANALKKAESQARRRATLAICGFGADDEENGKILQAKFYDPPQDVLPVSPLPTPHSLPAAKNELWRNWKSPEDALKWAAEILPGKTPEQIKNLFDLTPATNGKKAPNFYQAILDLSEEF
jgi:hypothetical protein